MRNAKLWLMTAMVALFAAVSQAQVTTGTISGTVTDSSGAVLPGAKIEIMHEGTGAIRSVVTDATGRYSAPQLAVGNYKLTAGIEGFQTEVHSGIVLTVGRAATVDVRLQVGAVTQTVEVTGEAPLVQTTESTVSYVVDDQTIRELPLNGRDLSQLILLNPGVNQSQTAGSQAYNGYGKRISISGMRGEDNTYLMDGQLIGDFRRHIPAGPSGALLGLESVQEFQVLTNSFGAQYGRALGGVFNAVSKSGTNELHGSAYEYLRNDKLDARNFFDRQEDPSDPRLPPFRRNQFGATLGGPIQRDKMFFFVAYESTREVVSETEGPTTMDAELRQGILKANGVPTGARVTVNPIMQPYINQWPLPNPGGRAFGDGTAEFVFQYKQPTTEHYGLTRVDFPSITDQDSFFVRFTASDSEGNASADWPGFEQASSNGSWAITLSETHIVSPAALNTVRVHFSRVVPSDTGIAPPPGPGITVVPGQSDPPEISVTGLTAYGGGGFDTKPTYMIANRFTYQDDVNWRMGNHGVQFGGFVERLQLNSSKQNRGWGVWTYNSVSNFLQANPNQYRGAIPGYRAPGAAEEATYERGFRQWFSALYIQDDWRMFDRLTLNLGVRWEPYSAPTEVNGRIANLRYVTDTAASIGDPYWENKSWGDIGPRIGFSWSPFASGKTSVRAGFGVLYAPNDPNTYYNQMDRMPPLGFDFTLPINALNPSRFPNARAQIEGQSSLGPAYAIPFKDNVSSRAIHWNFNIQQQIGGDSLLTVGYAGNRANHLISVGDLNIPRAVWNGRSLEIPNDGTRATVGLNNPVWPSILLFGNNTNSFYNALQVSYQKRFSSGFQAALAYTWARALAGADSGQTGGGVSAGGGRQKIPYEPSAQWGLSGYHFSHSTTFNYSYDLPVGQGMSGVAGALLSGWRTSGVLNLRTGQPQNPSQSVSPAMQALAVNPRSPNVNPSFTGEKILSDGRDPNAYINRDAYLPSSTFEFGNLGRNTLIGPGSFTWNPGVTKRTSFTETMNLEFRTEFFNVLNRANFGPPANNLFNATGNRVGTGGTISSTSNTSRQIQFALKLLW